MEQELYTLPEHLSYLPMFCGVLVDRSLVLCVRFVCSVVYIVVCHFVLFLFAIVCFLSFFDLRILILPLYVFKLLLLTLHHEYRRLRTM